MNSSPPHGSPQTPYRFSSEEMRVLQECNSESFFQRSLPFSALLGAGTYISVKNGYLSSHIKFGAAPKVVAAVIAGYILGKISYQGKCMEKLMALPDSKLAAALRERRRGFKMQDPLMMEPEEIRKTMGEIPSSEISGAVSENVPSHMGFDNERSSLDSDSFSTQFDDQKTDDVPAQDNTTTSYDELRRKNREDYESSVKNYKRTSGRVEEGVSASSPKRTSEPVWSHQKPKVTNKYGDSWEN